MKAKVVEDFEYNGLFFSSRPIPEEEHRDVTILGVTVPCDPGFVTIQDGDQARQVPTFALRYHGKLNIDYEALLTKTQIADRKRLGFLFGNGNDRMPTRLVPLDECPRVK